MGRSEILSRGLVVSLIVLFASLFNLSFGFAQEVKYKKNAVYITVPSDVKNVKEIRKNEAGEFIENTIDSIEFTGNSYYDFVIGPNVPSGVITIVDSGNVIEYSGIVYRYSDVGIPKPPAPDSTICGWDIEKIYMYYNKSEDEMFVGFDMYEDSTNQNFITICGDADDDNDPDLTSDWLKRLGGSDHPNFSGTEAIVLLLDTDNDNSGDVSIGISDALDLLHDDLKKFAAYKWIGDGFSSPEQHRYWKEQIQSVNVSLFTIPKASKPDLEFSIKNFTKLPGLRFNADSSFTFGLFAFAGSDSDWGVDEDHIPQIGKISFDYFYFDYGDAPSPYPTLYDENGAHHDTTYNLYLGIVAADADADGQPTFMADGDDNIGIDDETAFGNVPHLQLTAGEIPNLNLKVFNNTNKTAYLRGWIDYDGNGKWESNGKAERSLASSALIRTVNLTFPLVPDTSEDTTYVRFRISTNDDSINAPTGRAPDGEVEDYMVIINKYYDFGDAPDGPYPTLLANNGARHLMVPNQIKLKLGDKIDHEPDGQSSPGAIDDGEDEDGVIDENQLRLVEGNSPKIQLSVLNNTGQTAFLNGWINYKTDGVWGLSERAQTTILPATSTQNITLTFPPVPIDHPNTTYARFRISTDSSSISEATGFAPNGEVEDYQVRIDKYDFGDAPDPSYPTYLVNDGARHRLLPEQPNMFFGASVDQDGDGQPTNKANGDDTDPDGDDEDGIAGLNQIQLIAGDTTQIDLKVNNITGQTAHVVGWIDFDDDGIWEPNEKATGNIATSGTLRLTFSEIPDGSVDTTYARFRICKDAYVIREPHGFAPNGEVEDYKVEIVKLDFGDAPDDPYPTFLENNGARHKIAEEYKITIGNLIDHESNGLPRSDATGDDNNNIDDEDGVESDTLKLIEGTTPTIPFTVFNNSEQSAILYGWIDFNKDGQWKSDERDSLIVLSNPGSQQKNFIFSNHTVTSALDSTYARFRICTNPDSIREPIGFAPDGEVEDYLVKVTTLYDYGDAPDPQYPTLSSSQGARHKFLPEMNKLCLGDSIDFEEDGIPTSRAKGDDSTNIDDEDGLVAGDTLYLTVGETPSVEVTVTNETNKTVYVTGWIDYDSSGTWDTTEKATVTITHPRTRKKVDEISIAGEVPIRRPNSVVTLNFLKRIPLEAPVSTFARFRISTDESSITNPYGTAPDGEVEDYPVIIDRYDFGDAPDDSMDSTDYPTYKSSNGARHKVHPGLYFNRQIDHELDGQPTANADGDDINGKDDEDIFASSTITLGVGPVHQIQLPVVNKTGQLATVVGWIDYNRNDNWESNEKDSTTILSSGNAILKFNNIPQNETISTYARFRISTDSSCISTPSGQAPDGEVEDYKLKIIAMDFGDALDNPHDSTDYPTLLVSNGACHIIKSGFHLGAKIDFESDGQPIPPGLGDDANDDDDEDGVIFQRMPLIVCNQETLIVTASEAGFLDAWIDFYDDKDWDDPGEQIFDSVAVVQGSNILYFMVPSKATPDSQTFARFRFSSKGGLSYEGLAEDGEVEDHIVMIDGFDFGDAPDSTYRTLLADSGAYHKIKSGFFLGNYIDPEFDGQPNKDATGDDINGVKDDEDGINFAALPLTACKQETVIVTASMVGKLDAWIDFNNDGDWNDPSEQIFDSDSIPQLNIGQNTLTFTVPSTSKPAARTFARFRFSSEGGLSSYGPADDGEVEDHAVSIIALDFGDAPDDLKNADDYPTLLTSNGARHIIKSGFYLGNEVDCEGDGQPDPHALGDLPDEDGVVFNTKPLIIGRPATITVTASDTGILEAWIDFDYNGNWKGASEKVFSNKLIMPDSTTLTFIVPDSADIASQTFARFRFSSEGGLSYDGLAYDGEVEDYEVEIIGFDFGDAPDDTSNPGDYPTYSLSNGAYHKIKSGFHLGNLIDAEADGQPNSNATGDDSSRVADEEGVVFDTYPLIKGGTAQITVTVSENGKLYGWVDFNNDGDWKDDGEQIFDTSLVKGSTTLPFMVPDAADTASQTFARFRFSSQDSLSYEGYAADGEVEDYPVEIIAADFGDAPDDTTKAGDYPTLLESGGAFHKIKPGFYLGEDNNIDAEGDGQPDPKAEGDDNNGIDDEEGVKFHVDTLTLCDSTKITVTASSDSGNLFAWIDANCNGDWADPLEQVLTAKPLIEGENTFKIPVPAGTNPSCSTFVRFRFSSQNSLSYEGFAKDGEVEDYKVAIEGYDFGDAPDPFNNQPGRYPTLKAYDGAFHQIDSSLYLGESVDADSNGQPTTNEEAFGDDRTYVDDEDGLLDQDSVQTDILTLMVCDIPTVLIKVHNSTKKKVFVVGWIDYNGRNGWTEAEDEYEKAIAIVNNKTVIDTIVALKFLKVPSWSKHKTFARFRISSDFDLVDRPWGSAPDGEVEDYLVIIKRKKAAEVTSFEALAEKGQISINWATNIEPDCEHFVVYRSLGDSTNFVRIEEALALSEGDSTSGAVYHFTDKPDKIGTYYYKLECISPGGYSNFHGPVVVKLMTTVKPESSLPTEYSLSQNYPNPFNPETHIQFALPKEGQVTIEIYDLLGRLVRTIVDEYKPAGNYHVIWDARNSDGNVVSNGIYLVRMRAGTFVAMKKMTLIK